MLCSVGLGGRATGSVKARVNETCESAMREVADQAERDDVLLAAPDRACRAERVEDGVLGRPYAGLYSSASRVRVRAILALDVVHLLQKAGDFAPTNSADILGHFAYRRHHHHHAATADGRPDRAHRQRVHVGLARARR